MDAETTEEKLLLLKTLFPKMSPEWLKMVLDEIIRNTQDSVDQEEKSERLEKMFVSKVEEIFSLSIEELANLPTIDDWKEKQKILKNLEKVTNMSVENLIKT